MSSTASPSTASPSNKGSANVGQAPISRQSSQGPRVNNGASNPSKKGGNAHSRGESKGDAGRRSPQPSSNGQQAKKTQTKAKPSNGVSDYLRSRGATVEVAALVSQIRADLGGYFSEEQVFNTLQSNGNNADATRTALTQSKATSWASKVSPSTAVAKPSAHADHVPAPAHIAQQQQAPRPRKVRPVQEKKPASPEPVSEAVPVVDPEHLEKSLESALQAHQTQTQELLGLQAQVSTVRAAQADLTTEKDQLLAKIAQLEAEIAKDRTRINDIDASLSTHKKTLADLHTTIAQKTTKQH